MRRSLVALTSFFLVACHGGASQTTPTGETPFSTFVQRGDVAGYTAEARRRMSARLPGYEIEDDEPLTLHIIRPDGPGILSLDRPYATCRDDIDSCDAVTESFLDAMAV